MECGIGQMTVAGNANVSFASGLIGAANGASTFTLRSGNVSFSGLLQLANGSINVQGGALKVSKAGGNATLNLVRGSFVVSGDASVLADNLLITNGTAASFQLGNGPNDRRKRYHRFEFHPHRH
jgi:hypothetical protein